MLRTFLAVAACVCLAAGHACAQEWALKMFKTTSHDFGTIARGTKAQYKFQIRNVFEEDAHILMVKSSCNCTTPQVTRQVLKSNEIGEIIADFNTRDFQGQRSATLTVTLECVSRADIQLRVTGFIRSDVVMQPGAVDFGAVDFGSPMEKKLQVTHVGRGDWRIVDAKTAEDYFEVELSDPIRMPDKVMYDLLVRVTKDAPVGYIKDQLVLVTNDPGARELPVELEGRVVPDITISPTKLFIGVVHPGETKSRNLVVRGKKPFKIVDIKCDDKAFSIDVPKEAKLLHLIPVAYTAGEETGRVAQQDRYPHRSREGRGTGLHCVRRSGQTGHGRGKCAGRAGR